jgi:hypothetical protein
MIVPVKLMKNRRDVHHSCRIVGKYQSIVPILTDLRKQRSLPFGRLSNGIATFCYPQSILKASFRQQVVLVIKESTSFALLSHGSQQLHKKAIQYPRWTHRLGNRPA